METTKQPADVRNDVKFSKTVYWFTGWTYCLLFSGAIYGWPNLKAILKETDTYKNDPDATIRLGLIWTVGSWIANGGRFFAGVFLDSYGPRLTAFGAMSLAATACFIYAFADNHGAFMFATLCLGATSASQLSVQSFSSLFLGYEGLYMCTLSWAFQASSFLMLLAKVLIQNDIFSRQQCFSIFGSLALSLGLAALYLLPSNTFKSASQPKKSGEKVSEERAIALKAAGEESVWAQAMTVEYCGLCAFFGAMMLPLQFYMMTVGDQSTERLDEDMTTQFQLTYVASSCFAFISGSLIDRFGFSPVLILTISFQIIAYVLLMTDVYFLHIMSYSIYCMSRVTCFGLYFTSIGKKFGFTHFGKLVGFGIIFAACFSSLQFALLAWAEGSNYVDVDRFLLIFTALIYSYAFYEYWWERKHHATNKNDPSEMSESSFRESGI